MTRRLALLAAMAVVLCYLAPALASLAQTDDTPWTKPVNLSKSGAASLPVIAVGPDGSMHAMWWDAVSGQQYMRLGITSTTWTTPTVVPAIFGERRILTDTVSRIASVSLSPPSNLQLRTNITNSLRAYWLDGANALRHAKQDSGKWSASRVLAQPVVSMDVQPGPKGAMQLAYVRSVEGKNAPAGIYYATHTGDALAPALVYSSLYFRTAKPGDVRLSVAGDGDQNVLVLWDDVRFGSSYARSGDGGKTWSEPRVIGGSNPGAQVHAHLAAVSDGNFLLIWREGDGGVCRLNQRRSFDGGQTWSPDEAILGTLARCPEQISFAQSDDGRLWMIGTNNQDPASTATDPDSNRVVLAAWDGQQWSEPIEFNLGFFGSAENAPLTLNCPNVALAQQTIAVIGCDDRRDVWALRNAADLDQLVPALKTEWQGMTTLSGSESETSKGSVPSIAVDSDGYAYALWSQRADNSRTNMVLYLSLFDGTSWSSGTEILWSSAMDTEATGSDVSIASQPSLAVDPGGQLHAVWTAGLTGPIFYSWARNRDAASAQGWSVPVVLPMPSQIGGWPNIVADPRGELLYAVYSVPYNEKRGVYFVKSTDGRTAWSDPVAVVDAAAAGWDGVSDSQLALDPTTNALHATWLRTNLRDESNNALYYARSVDGGQTWSAPRQLLVGQIESPRIAVPARPGLSRLGASRFFVVGKHFDQLRGVGRIFAGRR